MDFSAAIAGIDVNFAKGTVLDGLGGSDSFVGMNIILGTKLSDTLRGGPFTVSTNAAGDLVLDFGHNKLVFFRTKGLVTILP